MKPPHCHRRRLVALVCLALVAAWGCDDDEPTDPNPTDVLDAADEDATDTVSPADADTGSGDVEDTGDDVDTADADPNDDLVDTADATPDADTAGCDPAACAATGQICDPVTSSCIDPPVSCETLGAACAPGDDLAEGTVCITTDDAATEGVCRAACDSALDCPEEQACLSLDGSQARWCQPDACGSWFDDDCAEGRCTPVATGIDLCLPPNDGSRVEYAPCTSDAQCAVDTMCLEGLCITPDCSVTSDEAPCPNADDVCVALDRNGAALSVGECRGPCQPWTSGACDFGQWCKPIRVDPSGAFVGACVVDQGVADDGEDCTGDLACDAGLVCARGVCKELCDPAAVDGGAACADATQACVPIGEGTPFEQPIGLCLTACEPFVDACGEGQWCAPNLFTEEAWCRPTAGRVEEAGFCLFDRTPDTTCADGLVCMETLDCRIACDPQAAPGSPGDTCGDGTQCAVLGNASGQQLFVGYCAPTCDYHGGGGCTDPVRTTCAMGEPFFQPFDLCLPPARELLGPDESCDDVGLYEYELCGEGGAICVPRPGDGALLCKDVCAASEGPFDMVGHPDCRDSTQLCEPVFGADEDLGLCMTP